MIKREGILRIAVVDDHNLYRGGLIRLIHSFGENYQVVIETDDGNQLLELLPSNPPIDIAVVDINMKALSGFDTVEGIRKKCPDVKILIVSMNANKASILRMASLGINGYVGKEIEPADLKKAFDCIVQDSFLLCALYSSRAPEGIPP